MTTARLLDDCRFYFKRAQTSWDNYFTKWEVMAKGEDIEDVDENWQSNIDLKVKAKKKKKKNVSVVQKLRNKSIAVLNKKKDGNLSENNKSKGKPKKKGVHLKILDQKRESEIIHTSENQTNLECEVVNNKHFEADLKAVFIEILSENTNKMGMFSVLSRMFSGSGDTISNFSLSSMTVEKNEFSISPVSETIFHSARHNEFLRRNLPPRTHVPNESQPQSTNGAFRDSWDEMLKFRAGDSLNNLRERHARHLYGGTSQFFTPLSHSVEEINISSPAGAQISYRKAVYNSPLMIDEAREEMKAEFSPASQPRNAESIPDDIFTSPNGVLARKSAPYSARKCASESARRSWKKRRYEIDYEDDSDDGNESVTKAVKILCTPTRRRGFDKKETAEPEVIAGESCDDDCFNLIDRVKPKKDQ